MSRVCEMCGKKPMAGRRIVRHGLAKYKGGIGLHITGVTKRRFLPNLKRIRVRAEEGGVKRMRICTACIKQDKVVKAG